MDQPAATPTAAPADLVLTDEEAARELRVSRRTLQRYRRHGGGPPYQRVGPRLVRYSLAEIRAWLARGAKA